jgi:hypothetical protein
VGLIAAVRTRVEVSMDLVSLVDEGPSMIYVQRSETKGNVDFKDLADGMNSAAITIW